MMRAASGAGGSTTTFRGVQAQWPRFRACVHIGGRRLQLGAYDDARTAAIVHDRAVLFLGLDTPLNLPALAKRIGPCSPEELRRQARLANKKKGGGSAYVGVSPYRNGERWAANVHVNGRLHFIGRYPDEETAARAHDRAALALGLSRAHLNFPNAGLRPASIEQLRKEAAAMSPLVKTSAYRGVIELPRDGSRCWRAFISRVEGYRTVSLGTWRTERQAALARDRAALHFGVESRKLNLPGAARKLGPASPASLREEAHRAYKEWTTSRLRGVSWEATRQLWKATIAHRRRVYVLGYFRDEVRAAEAYDEAARRLHKARAKPNFPP